MGHMGSNRKRKTGLLLMAAAVLATTAIELGPLLHDAWAVIGRPLTPMSYAGVARRTTRRTVAVTAAAPRVW